MEPLTYKKPHTASSRHTRTAGGPSALRHLGWIEKTTKLLDTAFRIPGTNFRFGLDPLLGLIPGAGDLISFGFSGALLLAMARHGASQKLVIKMLGNILLDATIGAIPILGDIFDATYKANYRNLQLLREYHEEGKHQGSGKGILVIAGLGLLGILALIVWGIWEIAEAIFS
ncbi:protein of unknown function [Catalinimonas alkaloidigena]|uniref:DUF4112 domain-containing protein n=1 Tax=Catalinimonas alkaloidigena TaxID=1075417 RepID=A0A1G9F183_9BACT|nr:DUF4112 domain-containing protein [Catalinimonas alkaloidigena]SDK82108.1 protein of unknown function [Catalinimonas alkaloidigena]